MDIKKAIRFAINAHCNQFRKGTKLFYIEHPIHVGMLLMKADQREEVIIAGILHDTLEDTPATEQILLNEFGAEVLTLVKGASEPERNLPWKTRKTHTIEFLQEAPDEVQMIALCDKLSNIMDMESDLGDIGDDLWKRFNAGYEEQKWYYTSLVDAFTKVNTTELHQDFSKRVANVFGT